MYSYVYTGKNLRCTSYLAQICSCRKSVCGLAAQIFLAHPTDDPLAIGFLHHNIDLCYN